MQLPGPRREQEGRGGAVANLVAMRCIIRCPLLAAITKAVPARPNGRKTGVPDMFWLFYLQATRQLVTQEQLDQELRAGWPSIREEFWFEHSILLPDAKTNGDVPNSDDFRHWRERNVPAYRVPELVSRLTSISLPLALAIRRAEGGDQPRPLHLPEVWDAMAVDGSTMDAPSDVRLVEITDDAGNVIGRRPRGSRAKSDERARVHHEMSSHDKKHGSQHGLCNLVAVVKGKDTYTRVVLGLDIAHTGEGEDPVAMRVLCSVYDQVGATFPVLLYDKAMKPVYFQHLMANYGIYCVNPNYAKPKSATRAAPKIKPGPTGPRTPLGVGRNRYGTKRGQDKLTYFTPISSVLHEADGYQHTHHVAADDGAVHETDRSSTCGGVIYKTALLETVSVERLQDDDGKFFLRLTVAGACKYGDAFTVSLDLRKTKLKEDGSLSRRSLVANVRVIPDASKRFARIYGRRNWIESFFSRLEHRFYNKDRHASWGRDNQLLDLLGASMVENVYAWAHLAYRHPDEAARLAAVLAGASQDARPKKDLVST